MAEIAKLQVLTHAMNRSSPPDQTGGVSCDRTVQIAQGTSEAHQDHAIPAWLCCQCGGLNDINLDHPCFNYSSEMGAYCGHRAGDCDSCGFEDLSQANAYLEKWTGRRERAPHDSRKIEDVTKQSHQFSGPSTNALDFGGADLDEARIVWLQDLEDGDLSKSGLASVEGSEHSKSSLPDLST